MAHILAKLNGVKVEDLKKILIADKKQHAKKGLYLEYIWKNEDNPDEVMYLFLAEDMIRARQFISDVHTKAINDNPNANLPQMTFLEEK